MKRRRPILAELIKAVFIVSVCLVLTAICQFGFGVSSPNCFYAGFALGVGICSMLGIFSL
jgi:hypothetical protein